MKSINQRVKIQEVYRVGRSRSGLGLFAVAPIKKGEFVIEYTGEKLSNREVEERNSKYFFSLNSRWTIDGSDRKNVSRYLNHSCRPNCEAVIEDGKNIMIYAVRNIRPGEELTYDYGQEYFKEYIKPLGCRCDYCQRKK